MTTYRVNDDLITCTNILSGEKKDLTALGFSGFYIFSDFIGEEKETQIVEELLSKKEKWVESVSGRLKMDYGPQANFKKKKLKQGNFEGLPKCLEDVISKIVTIG